MFPRGNREGQNTAMSLYLNAADAEAAPVGWNRRASFKLTVVNHLNPEQSIAKGLCSCCIAVCAIRWIDRNFAGLESKVAIWSNMCVGMP